MQKCSGGILLLFIQGPIVRLSEKAYIWMTLKGMYNLDLKREAVHMVLRMVQYSS